MPAKVRIIIISKIGKDATNDSDLRFVYTTCASPPSVFISGNPVKHHQDD